MKIGPGCSILASLLLSLGGAACSGSANAPPDAGPDGGPDGGPDAGAPDAGLGCRGLPLPTTAPATVAIAGTVYTQTFTGTSPVVGATVELFASSGGAAITTTLTGSAGQFSVIATSGGAPLDAYLHAHAATYTDTYWYPSVPLTANQSGVQVAMFTPALLGVLRSLIPTATQPAGAGMSGMQVVDCAGAPLANAVVTTSPAAGTTAYIISNFPSGTATATDASGASFLFDVTAGPVTFGATVGGAALRSHVVNVRPDVVTETSVQP